MRKEESIKKIVVKYKRQLNDEDFIIEILFALRLGIAFSLSKNKERYSHLKSLIFWFFFVQTVARNFFIYKCCSWSNIFGSWAKIMMMLVDV